MAKYAGMEDLSPSAPVPAPRERPAPAGHEEWVASVLGADLGAPRRQRHTARRVYDRLVSERGCEGSHSTVRRFVGDWRLARSAGAGEGCLELEWPVGACQADFGSFRAVVAGEAPDPKPLVATLPHSSDGQCVALRSQRPECLRAGLAEVLSRRGRAPRAVVPDDATEAGRPVRGEVTESGPFSRFGVHYRFESRCRDPCSGNGRGSVGNAVGFLRRNLLVPVPSVASVAGPSAPLAEGCARPSAAAPCRDGRPSAKAPREDLAGMRALPGVALGAARGPRPAPTGAAASRSTGASTWRGPPGTAGTCWSGCAPTAWGSSPTAAAGWRCRPARSRPSTGWTRSAAGGPRGRQRGRAPRRGPRRRSGSSRAAARPTAPPSTRSPGGSPPSRGAPTSPRATGSRGRRRMAAGDALARGAVEAGGARSLTTAVLGERSGLGTPRRVGCLAGHPEAERASREASRRAALPGRCALPAPKTLGGHDWPAVSRPEGMGRESPTSPEFPERREDLVPMGGVGRGKAHMAPALRSPACEAGPEARFFTASSLVMRLRRARDEGRLDRESEAVGRARLLVIDEPGFLPLDPDGARPLFQVFADACERQSAVITTNLESGRRGSVLGDDQMAAAVIDRVVHHGRLIRFRGESYRVRSALMREA